MLIPLVLAALVSASAAPPALLGVWSGDQLQMTATADGARVEAGCGAGQITGPLHLDDAGRFSAHGQFEAYAPGPQRADEPGEGHPATYSGRVRGDTMNLTVTGESVQHYRLTRGQRVKLTRCL